MYLKKQKQSIVCIVIEGVVRYLYTPSVQEEYTYVLVELYKYQEINTDCSTYCTK